MQPIVAVASGGSPGTPSGGVEGEVIVFPDLESLRTSKDGALSGKIVLVDRKMVRMQDASGARPIAAIREKGPVIAARKGAIAFMHRSVTTDYHRLAFTGSTEIPREGQSTIPSFAISLADADQIDRLEAMGETVRVRLESGASYVPNSHSQNVVAEIPGSEHPEEIVLLGAHLDSWDQGTGATDDGAGVAIIIAAAKLIAEQPVRPKRTIRIVLFGAEEVDQPNGTDDSPGGIAYFNTRKVLVARHVIGSECDHGADRVIGLSLPEGFQASAFAESARRLLDPIGVLVNDRPSSDAGLDLDPMVAAGMPIFALRQDRMRQYDYHHTADDTLDKIDPAQLNQNVASWASLVWLIANSDTNFRPPSSRNQ